MKDPTVIAAEEENTVPDSPMNRGTRVVICVLSFLFCREKNRLLLFFIGWIGWQFFFFRVALAAGTY